MTDTFSLATDGLADLALPIDLESKLADAIREPGGFETAQRVEDAVNAALSESGWDGDWNAEQIVRDALARS